MGRADNLLGAGKPLNILPRIRVGSSAPTVETTSSHAQLNGGKDRHRRDPSDKSSVSKPVKQLRPDIDYYSWILAGSFILCFNAGYVNALTLNTAYQAPSAHVTGMVAQASKFTARGDGMNLMRYAVSYGCFLLGAMTSGVVVQHEAFYLGRMYGRVLLLLSAIWGVALIVESHFDRTIYFVWICAFSCGLQNGMTSKYSGNALRTTHLTGTTTDLGIALGHILFQRKNEWWKVQVHVAAVSGFFLGGIGGHHAFQRYEHLALMLSICLSSFCGIMHTAYLAYHEQLPFFAVLESKRDIMLHKDRVRVRTHSRHSSLGASSAGSTSSGDMVEESVCLSPRNSIDTSLHRSKPHSGFVEMLHHAFRVASPATGGLTSAGGHRADGQHLPRRDGFQEPIDSLESGNRAPADGQEEEEEQEPEYNEILPPPEELPPVQDFDEDDVAAWVYNRAETPMNEQEGEVEEDRQPGRIQTPRRQA